MKNKKKKKKFKKADINISENIIVSEQVSYNSFLLDDIDFHSRTLLAMADVFRNQLDEIKSKLDSLSELGEMESLRLQMAMDRFSKFMQTLSNLLKKMEDVQSLVTQNIK
jgi:hypothetical protein